MTCPGTEKSLAAGMEAPRYTTFAWPYGARQQLVTTDSPTAIAILESLEARFSPKHGWFLSPSRARMFEALMEAGATAIGDRSYRFPDGSIKTIYQATRYMRTVLGKKVHA